MSLNTLLKSILFEEVWSFRLKSNLTEVRVLQLSTAVLGLHCFNLFESPVS
jgi:hypothetical protein